MTLFDTTIRDGSYYVDFKLSSEDVRETVDKISKLGFPYIEIGHGKGLGASSLENGLSMETDIEYMNAANKVRRDSKLGFFCIPGIAKAEDISTAAENNMSFIRVGQNADEIGNAKKYVLKAKELGLEVMVNLMKSYVISPDAFAEAACEIKKWGADAVYIVDSSGGMLPEQLKEYYYKIKEKTDVKLGYHGHNNLGLAVCNALTAWELGFDYIDTTLQGVGRSIGNVVAEEFVMALEKKGVNTGFDIPRLLEYGYYVNQNIFKRPSFGPLDLICGYADFHSSNLKTIYKCCMEKGVDPMRLIIAYSKVDKKNVDYQLLCEIADTLPVDTDKNPYDFRKYFTDSYH